MKKKFSILMAGCLLVLLAMTACGKSETPEAPSPTAAPAADPAPAQSSGQSEPEPAPQASMPSVSFDGITAAFAGAEWIDTYYYGEALCVYLDVTNTSRELILPSMISYDAEQNGTALGSCPSGDMDELGILEGNHSRYLFPGVTVRVASLYTTEDKEASVAVMLGYDAEEQELTTLDPASLPDVLPPPAIGGVSPSFAITAMPGYAGTEASFESFFSGSGDLKIVAHDFMEVDGEKYVRVYFDLVITDGIDAGETERPGDVVSVYCFQDGRQIGYHNTMDDHIGLLQSSAANPELEAQRTGVGLDEPVSFAIAYKLWTDSDITIAATFIGMNMEYGDTFISDTFPVE